MRPIPSRRSKRRWRMPSGAAATAKCWCYQTARCRALRLSSIHTRKRGSPVMAKNGFKMIDAEMHVMEPVDLWQRYIDPEFADRAPRRLDERKWDIRTMVEGEVMAAMPGGDWPAVSDAEEQALATRYAEEIARDFDPESQVK